MLLELRGLRYSYPGSTSPALNGVSLSVLEGERLAIVGANGSGKSTLLMHMAGCFSITDPASILLSGAPVERGCEERLRRAVGLVFQDPDDQLFMPSVLEDVAFTPIARGMGAPEARALAMEVLEALGIAAIADRPPHRLSGGEKRLAALAGVLAARSSILALDEPSASLDPRSRRLLINTLSGLPQAMVIATHDLDMASRLCSDVILMNKGAIAARGKGILGDEEVLRANGM